MANSPALAKYRLWLGGALLLALVLLAVLRSAAGTRLDSLTVDEPWHIVAGTIYARATRAAGVSTSIPSIRRW